MARTLNATNQVEQKGYLVLSKISIGNVECKCGRCTWRGMASELEDVKACDLKPGDVSPAGRCPKCMDLAYPNRSEDREMAYSDQLHKRLAELVEIQETLDKGRPLSIEVVNAKMGAAKELLKAIKGRKMPIRGKKALEAAAE